MNIGFVVFSVLVTVAVSQDTKWELTKKLEAANEACKGKMGLTKEDLHPLMKTQTKTGHCFAACTGKEIGVITDKKINMVEVKALCADLKDKFPEVYNISMKIFESCAHETDTDECVAAKKIMDCVTQRSKKARGELMKKTFVVCMKKTGATTEDLMTVSKNEVPQTKTGQCFVACAGKELGVIIDNKINMKLVQTLNSMFPVHTELDDKIMKVIEDCAKETDTDECVAAKKIMGCIKEGAEKNGITKLV